MKHGFIKTVVATPKLISGDITNNTKEIIASIIKANTLGAQIIVFPELALSGSCLGELYNNHSLTSKCEEALTEIITCTKQRELLVFVGMPIRVFSKIFIATVVIYNGALIGAVPKSTLTLNEQKYFDIPQNLSFDEIDIGGYIVPFDKNLLFQDPIIDLNIGVNNNNTVESFYFLGKLGANVVVSQHSSPKLINNIDRKDMLKTISKEFSICILDCGSSQAETHDNSILSPAKAIVECGDCIAFSDSFEVNTICSDIDIERISAIATTSKRVECCSTLFCNNDISVVDFKLKKSFEVLDRTFDRFPFVPKSSEQSTQIIDLLIEGIYRKVCRLDSQSIVVGVLGDINSALTLLLCNQFCEKFDFPINKIICVLTPSKNTSENSMQFAENIISAFGMTKKLIPINGAITLHLNDISQSGNDETILEHCVARERTQILLDVASITNGLLIGSQNMSEQALGAYTFGGEHLAMYQTNGGICKTTVFKLVEFFLKRTDNLLLKKTLEQILNASTENEFKTECQEKLNLNYDLCDFFLYNFIHNGYSGDKLQYIAEKTYDDIPTSEIKKNLKIFLNSLLNNRTNKSFICDNTQIFETLPPMQTLKLSNSFNPAVFKE